MAEAIRTLAGVTADTFKHLQIGAGALLVNFDYDAIRSPEQFREQFLSAIRNGHSLGGTNGGVNINVTPEYRRIEIDGANIPFKGDSVIDSWECYMETTLKEFTPDVMQAAFPTAEFADTADGITAMRIRTGLSQDDYMKNTCWIATTQYGWVMVAMHNTLGRTTGAIASGDKDEGDIPFRVDGHIDNFDAIDFAPCEIWFVDMHGFIDRVSIART